jgi:hypothetical protein
LFFYKEVQLNIYGILDASARAWWYHRQLREQGRADEARSRERASTRERVSSLKQARANGGFVTIGRGGWTLHIAPNHKLQGIGDLSDPIPQCALRLGLPILDSTTIPDDKIHLTVALPFAQVGAVPRAEYDSFDPASIEVVAWMYVDLGATVRNVRRTIPVFIGGPFRGQWQCYDTVERQLHLGCVYSTRAECQEACDDIDRDEPRDWNNGWNPVATASGIFCAGS